MDQCFVMQPFDGGKFDQRFEDCFKPAIEAAGLKAYRVDQDPKTDVIVEQIEKNIRESAVCFAEITTDKPNVWYELGYANAKGKGVAMVCEHDRPSPLPFDIRHRHVILYPANSSSDFAKLQDQITEKLLALKEKQEELRILSASPLAQTEGMSNFEIAMLATVAGEAPAHNDSAPSYRITSQFQSQGFNAVYANLALRKLERTGFIEKHFYQSEDSWYCKVTDAGWDWLESHIHELQMQPPANVSMGDDIPF